MKKSLILVTIMLVLALSFSAIAGEKKKNFSLSCGDFVLRLDQPELYSNAVRAGALLPYGIGYPIGGNLIISPLVLGSVAVYEKVSGKTVSDDTKNVLAWGASGWIEVKHDIEYRDISYIELNKALGGEGLEGTMAEVPFDVVELPLDLLLTAFCGGIGNVVGAESFGEGFKELLKVPVVVPLNMLAHVGNVYKEIAQNVRNSAIAVGKFVYKGGKVIVKHVIVIPVGFLWDHTIGYIIKKVRRK